MKKKEFKTFEQMALDKLQTVQPASAKQWAEVIGMTQNSMYPLIRRVKAHLIIIDGRPRLYKVKVKECNENEQ